MDSAPLDNGALGTLGNFEIDARRGVANLGWHRGPFWRADLDRDVVKTGLPCGDRPNDTSSGLALDLHGADVCLRAVPHEDAVLAPPRGFPPVKGQMNAAVVVNLGLGTEDLPFLRAEVGRPIAIELDAVAEVCELELVQPSCVHLDVESEKDAQRCVVLDVDRSPGAFHHRARPRLCRRRRA